LAAKQTKGREGEEGVAVSNCGKVAFLALTLDNRLGCPFCGCGRLLPVFLNEGREELTKGQTDSCPN